MTDWPPELLEKLAKRILLQDVGTTEWPRDVHWLAAERLARAVLDAIRDDIVLTSELIEERSGAWRPGGVDWDEYTQRRFTTEWERR